MVVAESISETRPLIIRIPPDILSRCTMPEPAPQIWKSYTPTVSKSGSNSLLTAFGPGATHHEGMCVSSVPSQSHDPVLVTTQTSIALHCVGRKGDELIELTSLPSASGMQISDAIVKMPEDSEKFRIILSQAGQPWCSFQDSRSDNSTAVVERDKQMLKTLPLRKVEKLIINPTPGAGGTIREARTLEALGSAPSNWSSVGPACQLESRFLSPSWKGPIPTRKRQREHSPDDDHFGCEPGRFESTPMERDW
jgi:hypothetical protein